MVTLHKPHLEKQTSLFLEDLAQQKAPPLYTLSPQEAREVLENLQSSPVEKPDVTIQDKKILVGKKADISIRIVRPKNVQKPLPVVIYLHGGGWVLGSQNTHDRLVRELAHGSEAAVVFVNYSRSPEAKFPIALEESFAVLKYISEEGSTLSLDPARIAIVGDSVGGNMSISLTLLAQERKGPKISALAMFYPVTNSELNTPSYEDFAHGPWLTKPAMQWFWNAYESDTATRKKPLLSPLLAPLDQLKHFPQTLIITAENDVLRDEGEAFAHRLMEAGVKVTATRFLGTIHDFMMLNGIAKTPAVRGAIALANSYLFNALHNP